MISLPSRREILEELPSLSTVSAWLRLGKKYDVQYLYQTALCALQEEFPSTLDDWLVARDDCVAIRYQDGLIFESASIALDMDIMSILPTVYVQCLDEWVCPWLISKSILLSVYLEYRIRSLLAASGLMGLVLPSRPKPKTHVLKDGTT